MAATAVQHVQTKFRPDIQGLRGIAVVLVVLYHARVGLTGGFIGVDVFFVISGYLIIGLLVREVTETGTVALRSFVARRVRRILPALATALTLTMAAMVLLHPLGGQFANTVATARGAALLVANFVIYRRGGYFGEAPESNALLHTWSLSVEEQFYLAVPLLVIGVAAMRRGRGGEARLLHRALLFALVVSFAASVWLTLFPSLAPIEAGARFAFLSPVTRAWQFCAGGLLATSEAVRSDHSPRGRSTSAGLVGFGLILGAAIAFDPSTPFPGLAAVVPTAGAMLLLVAGRNERPNGVVTAIVSSRALRWIGDRSYSWYLLHWPAVVIAGSLGLRGPWWAMSMSMAALPAAAATYRFVEQPFRLHRRISSPVIASVSIVAPAALAWLLVVLGGTAAAASLPQDSYAGRDVDGLLQFSGTTDVDPFHCDRTRGVCEEPGRPILLVLGDSLAEAAFPGIRAAIEPHGWSAVIASRPGCPFIVGAGAGRGIEQVRRCIEYSAEALAWIARLAPDAVLIHQYTNAYISPIVAGRDTEMLGVVDADGTLPASPVEARAIYGSALVEGIDRAQSAGAMVLVLEAAPEFDAIETVVYPSLIRAWLGERADLTSDPVTIDDMRARTVSARRLERSAAASTGAHALDPMPVLCAGTRCSRFDGGVPLYRDPIHLTLAGAGRVGALVATVLTAEGEGATDPQR